MTQHDPKVIAEIVGKLDQAQRRFILKKRATLDEQPLSKADWEAIDPCVETGREYPDVLWFGGMVAAYGPGTKQPTRTFRFNPNGRAVRSSLLDNGEGK